MRLHRISYFLTIVFILSLSCKEGKKTSEASTPTQMERVMQVHDELMPKMNDINSLISKLREKVDSESGDTRVQDAITELQGANKDMMDWMMAFGEHFNSGEIMNGDPLTEDKQRLLDEDEKKMDEVKQKMMGSIAKAQALLGGK